MLIKLSRNYTPISGADTFFNRIKRVILWLWCGNSSINGPGGGLANNGSNPVIQNSIYWGNQDSSGVGMAVSAISNTNSTPTISYSLVQSSNGSGDDWNQDLEIDLGNSLDADPCLLIPLIRPLRQRLRATCNCLPIQG